MSMPADATDTIRTYIGHCTPSSMSLRIARAEACGSLGLPFPLLFLLDAGSISSTMDRLRLADEAFVIWLPRRLEVVVATARDQ